MHKVYTQGGAVSAAAVSGEVSAKTKQLAATHTYMWLTRRKKSQAWSQAATLKKGGDGDGSFLPSWSTYGCWP